MFRIQVSCFLCLSILLQHSLSRKHDEGSDVSKFESLRLREQEPIYKALRHDRPKKARYDDTIRELTDIYETTIKPMEEAYKYNDLSEGTDMSVGQIQANPLVLFLGPWSTGKTTMLDYILDTDVLRKGAEPTTSEFTIVSYDEQSKKTEGVVLVSDKTKGFSALEKYGQNFLERFTGIGMPHPLLRRVTFLDTPGIIENRKQQERGYPFNKVVQWFIDRAQLILIVFDPTKLDVGLELETLFKQLKGKESQIRLILNKADSIATQELMRVYGALFWSLAPLINVTEPPRVYTGSFWKYEYKQNTNTDLFKQEESSLLQDLNDIIENRLENNIALVRQHATRVRMHALIINEFLERFQMEWTFLQNKEQVLANVISSSSEVFKAVKAKYNISPFDLPDESVYRDFFSINPLPNFQMLQYHCSYFSGCPITHLENAISNTLPGLLGKLNTKKKSYSTRDEM